MNVVISGCSRAGAMIARTLASQGNTVTVVDSNEENLRRLTESIELRTLLGDATQDEDLIMAGIEQAEAFLAVETRDARNILAAQKALHTFGVKNVICHIADPTRQQMYAELGLKTVSTANILSDMILEGMYS